MNINTWKKLAHSENVASVASVTINTYPPEKRASAHFFMPEIKNIPLKYGIVKTSMWA